MTDTLIQSMPDSHSPTDDIPEAEVQGATLLTNITGEQIDEAVADTSPTRKQPTSEIASCNSHDCAQQHNISTIASVIHLQEVQASYELQLQKLKKDLESMVLNYAKSERENIQKQNRVDDLEKKLKRALKDNDQLANRIRLLTNDKNQLTDTLNAKVAQLTVLEQKKLFLNSEQKIKLEECEEKLKILESANDDMTRQITSYKIKEGELIDSCERLSMRNMTLQTDLDEVNNKVPEYKNEYDAVLAQLTQQNQAVELLTENLIREQEINLSLQTEKEKNEVAHATDLDKLQNEIKVMRRKHQTTTKELIKEIRNLQVRLEKYTP